MSHAAAPLAVAWWASSPSEPADADSRYDPNTEQSEAANETPPLSPSDATTVARVAAGDLQAFDSLYLKLYPMLHRLARHWCRSPDAADDLVQEIFFDLWIRRATWTVRTSVTAYFVGAMRNKLRRQFRDATTAGRITDIWTSYAWSPGSSETQRTPQEATEQTELVAAVTRAVNTLPPRQRMAALLHWHDGLSSGEIAEVMEISDRVARKMIATGLVKLRSALVEARALRS